MSAEYPDDLKYTREHEWARPDAANPKLVTIGITKFAVEQLGDVTQVDLPKEGEKIKKNDVFGSVESVKAVSDLYAPVSGTVVKVNSLGDSPEYLNDDPYDEGWMIQVEMDDPADLAALLSVDDYTKFVAEQGD